MAQMTDAQRAALTDHDLRLTSTLMDGCLLARNALDVEVLIDPAGNIHTRWTSDRRGRDRVTPAELPPAA